MQKKTGAREITSNDNLFFLMLLAAIIITELLINNLITQKTGDHINCEYHLLWFEE